MPDARATQRLPSIPCMKMPAPATTATPPPAAASQRGQWRSTCALLGAALLLGACAVHEPRRAAPALYFYPKHGQSEQRLDRDRFECYQWASRQSRSDFRRAMSACMAGRGYTVG